MSSTAPTGSRSKFQKFETGEVPRSLISEAAYNPRVMPKENAKLLKRGLKTLGLVEPLVWNKRTGNLVGGHQRLRQIDELEGGQDYSLTLSIVDVDAREERRMNLALNNTNIQGIWDNDALAELLKTMDQEDYTAIGITEADLDFILEDESPLAMIERSSPEREVEKDTLKNIKENRAAFNEKMDEEQGAQYMLIVLFAGSEEQEAFYKRFDLHPADSYVRSQDLLAKMGVDV